MGTPLGLFRSHVTPIDRLVKMTVGRKEMLDDLLEKLRRNAGRKGGQHYFFIGPRGIGKTHFLSLLQHAVESGEDLTGRYTVVRFPEENSRILSFADILLEIAFSLGEAAGGTEWRDIHRALAVKENDQEIIDTVVPLLKRYQRETGKTLLLLMENLNALLTEQIKKEQDIHRLRTFLMDTPCATLIGTAPVFFPGITSQRSPLFEFFDIQVLEELGEELTIELIRRNLELDGRNDLLENFDPLIPKIKALHVMTGGNPRLLMMLYELIAHENILDVKVQFQKLLDQITPFYQDRLKELAPQERALLMTMALMRTVPRTPASIAAEMRKSQQQTSSLLKRMTAAGYLTVSENPHDKRSRLYRIKEGFFDLWLAMSESRRERGLLEYLVKFFEIYYRDPQEREKKRAELWGRVEKDAKDSMDWSNDLEHLHYLSAVGEEPERFLSTMELILHRLKEGDAGRAKDFLEELPPVAVKHRPTFTWMTEQAFRWSEAEVDQEVRKWLDDMVAYWQTQRSGDLEKAVAIAKRLGVELSGKGLHAIRIELLNEVLQNTPVMSEQIGIHLQIAQSQNMGGQNELALNTLEKALALCRKFGDRHGEGAMLNNIGELQNAMGKYDLALENLQQSLAIVRKIGEQSGEGTVLNNIGRIHAARGDYDEALKLLQKSLSIAREMKNSEGEGTALGNTSIVYYDRGEFGEALRYQQLSLSIMRSSGNRGKEGAALNNIGEIHAARGELGEALKWLQLALTLRLEIGDRAGESSTRTNIGQVYLREGKTKEALKYFKDAWQIALKGDNLEAQFHAGFHLGFTLCLMGERSLGITLIENAVRVMKATGHRSALDAESLLQQIRN